MSCWSAPGCAPTGRPPARDSTGPRWSWCGRRARPLLTEEELTVFRRGRNAHVHSIPHSASRAQYLRATALECLLGDLYLRGELERINQLFRIMMEE